MSLVEQIREAAARRQPLRIVGAGTWLDAGRSVNAQSTISLADHRGIVDYVPGDLTLTARAGTRLSEIAESTRAHGQWLPLDPWGGDAGTLGATISTATAGPHAASMGLPRDVVLGVEFVTGAGQIVRAGGRVVKNVAGFDLARLIVGAWGTLGVVTEATVRLRALPERIATTAIRISPDSLGELAVRLRALPFTPIASEVVNAALAARLGLARGTCLVLRLGGNGRSLAAQRESVAAFGALDPVDETVWEKLRGSGQPGSSSWRWSNTPTRFGETWHAAERLSDRLDDVMLHGNPIRGVVRVLASGDDESLARILAAKVGTTVAEKLPPSAWRAVPSTIQDPISSEIRRTFDPSGILNRGILGAIA